MSRAQCLTGQGGDMLHRLRYSCPPDGSSGGRNVRLGDDKTSPRLGEGPERIGQTDIPSSSHFDG